jgi:ferritin-like metal-binding protein YciE
MEMTLKQSQFYGLFLSELKEMLWVEQQALTMPGLAQGAIHSSDLLQTLAQGQLYASQHVDRLRQLFGFFGETAEAIESAAMGRLIESVERAVLNNFQNRVATDLPVIIAIQKTVQYKMACYENLISLAQIVGEQAAGEFLESNIIDDAATNLLLRELSERYIYKESALRKRTAPL